MLFYGHLHRVVLIPLRWPLYGVDRLSRTALREKTHIGDRHLSQLSGVPPPRALGLHPHELPRDSSQSHWLERESLPAAFISPPVDDTFLISVSRCCCRLTHLPISTSHLYTPRSKWPICVQPRRGIRCPSVIYLITAPI